MSKSLFVTEYDKANRKDKDIRCFYQEINVSYLDVLKENEVEITIKDYVDCVCKSKEHLHTYFDICNKCNGEGYIVLNGHKLTCNKCDGQKYIRVNECYLCNNESKILKSTKKKIKLNNKLNNNSEISFEYPDYKLILRVNIYDKEDYLIKDNDIYYLKTIKYSKEDRKNNKSKKIKTYKGYEYVTSEFKVKKEVRKILGQGIDNGDFYFIFDNELENEKEVIFGNVLIDNTGYIKVKDFVNLNFVEAKKEIALNETNYVYVNENVSEVNDDNYVVKLNKLNKNEFIIENDTLVYVLKLNKEDSELDKKNIVINNEKINVSFKKNLKETNYINVANKGLYTRDGKREDLRIKIIPYYENVYKIKIKKNKDIVYIEDYKYKDNRLVESFKRNDYLQDYIKIKDETEVVVNSDLILIERV